MSNTDISAPPFQWSAWYKSDTAYIVGGTPSAQTLSFDFVPDTDANNGPYRVQVVYASSTGFEMKEETFTEGGAMGFTIAADTASYVYFRVMGDSPIPVGIRETDTHVYDPVSAGDVPVWTPADPGYTPPEPQGLSPPALPAFVPADASPFHEAPAQGSPLVIDLSSSHTGVTLTTFNASTTTTFFDIEGTGFATQTAWVSGDTGLLARDLNSNGKIDGVSELFGSQTVDGFAKLAVLDSNGDLKIDHNDSAWSSLVVWVDANHDAVTQSGELHSLDSLGITSIDLAGVAASTSTIGGNPISHTSTVTFTGGATAAIDDAWFLHDTANSYYAGDYTLNSETLFLPDLRGFGQLPDLHIAMSQNSDLLSAMGDFASGFTNADFADNASLDATITNILYQWAGVDGVDPSSRGPNIDARQLEFLEKFFGQDFQQTGWNNDPNPAPQAAALLDHSWHMVFEDLKADLLLQVGEQDLFNGNASYNPWTGAIEGTLALDHTAVTHLADDAPAPGSSNLAYWTSVAEFLDHVNGLDNLTSTENGWLNDAVQVSDSGLTWSDVKDHLPFVINGTSEGGEISGTNSAETINGGAGDDTIYAYNGDDTVNAGGGNDTVWGGGDPDTIHGGDGNDTIYGQDGADHIYGDAGNDTIYADDSTGYNDILEGGTGGNFLYGGAGNDTYVYGGGNDVIQDSSGTDQITLPSGITAGDITITRISTGGSTTTFDDVGSSRVDLQACKLEYSIVSPK